MKQLIPMAYLKEKCMLSDKVDERKYVSALEDAQLSLKETIGPEFYEEIETQYDPNTDTFTTDNATLYEDYIKAFLAWETYSQYLPLAQMDSTGTGLRVHNDTNSALTNDLQFFSVTKTVREKAQKFKTSMVTYLKLEQEKDSTKYPLFRGCVQNTYSFGFSSISGSGGESVSIHKAIITNE